MKKGLNHIKLSGIKEFSLMLVFALLLISQLAISQSAASNRFKRIDYDYDLISGKVNTVSYQKDSVDQFIHQYTYDADNRITKVETSSDNVIWDIDAKYFYYAHGPLSRTELGNNKVQGVDYAYTLQGWIKGVNSNSLDKSRDIGQDGLANGIYDPANPQLHSNIARDAFGYTLNYYQNDYRAIDVSRWSDVKNRFEAEASATSTLKTNRFDLFNGNISSMVTTITQLDSTAAGLAKAQIPKPLGNAYKYDQLNRLKKSVSFNNTDLPNNLWLSSGQAVANMYSNTFTYDANGNILSQNRNNELGTEFDAMSYNYKRDANNKFLQNRLYHVNDNTTYTALKTDDIDDEGTFTSDNLLINTNNNYGYDAIGNLTKDNAEGIDKIEWTVYGKIKSITRTGGSTKDNLVFNYDAAGNRISKKVLDNGNNVKYTIYYVRDAQGNVMSTYEHKYMAPAGGGGTPVASYILQEQHLYGSSRIGMNTPSKQLIYPTVLSNGTAYNHVQGLKQFELSNHLGNVLAVITDRKLPVDVDGDNLIDYYQADITSTSDYSAFGVKLYNRGFSFENYRYGFNGKENDDETGTQDYGMRIYNPALGKFLSVDPIAKEYPWNSTYAFAENTPIQAIDLDGAEKNIVIYYYDIHNEITKIRVNRIEDKNGNALDNEFWKTNPNIAKTDVLEVHIRANGSIDYKSTNSLTTNQNTIKSKYTKQGNPMKTKSIGIKIDGQSIGLNEGKEHKSGTFKRSQIDLDQTIDVQFKSGTDKILPGESAKLLPVINILNDFPGSSADIKGNTASDGVKPGAIYGTSNSALNQPSSLNSTTNNSTVGGVQKARANAVEKIINDTGIDSGRTDAKTGTHSSDPGKRNVNVKIKGVD